MATRKRADISGEPGSADALSRRAGRDVARFTFFAGALAKELVERFHVKPKRNASFAACESIVDRYGLAAGVCTGEAVERRRRQLSRTGDCSMMTPKGDKIVIALISDGFIDDAMTRLARSVKQVGWTKSAGEPVFVFSLARLSNKKSGNK